VSLVAVNTESILDLNAMLLSHLQKSKIKVESMLPPIETNRNLLSLRSLCRFLLV
jgi:hypothetical protein